MLQISLKAARVNAGLTQKDVAKAVDVDVSTIMNWENGKSSPRAPQIVALSELYGIPIDNIFLREKSTLSEQ